MAAAILRSDAACSSAESASLGDGLGASRPLRQRPARRRQRGSAPRRAWRTRSVSRTLGQPPVWRRRAGNRLSVDHDGAQSLCAGLPAAYRDAPAQPIVAGTRNEPMPARFRTGIGVEPSWRGATTSAPYSLVYRIPPRRFFNCAPMMRGSPGAAQGANVPPAPGIRAGARGDEPIRSLRSLLSLAPEATPVVTKTYQNLIGGDWTPAGSGATFTSVSPANHDDVIGEFAASGPADVDAAVAAATRAYPALERHAGAEARRDPLPHRAPPGRAQGGAQRS